jgi:zinc protease
MAADPAAIDIPYREQVLDNGLRVIVHEDHKAPIVAVNIWYHVGSKNEAQGRTGFAHLFEHMMFQGSKNYVDGWRGVDELGGNVNGTTDQDRTYYFEVVPSNFLERVLYLEADRMGNLLDAMSQEKLDNQRDVVKNERRFRVDNVPYGNMFERIGEIMYPEGHPYHHSVIGSMEDLSAASLDDVKSFFRQYYVPNNAVLVLSGDFDEKQARAWIEKYFGPIAKGSDINRPNMPEPKLNGEIRKSYDEPGIPLPRLTMVWHSVPQYAPDEAPLDMLSSILSTGRGSRLQSDLVYGKELAQQIFANNGTSEIAGLFQISATAKRPDQSLDELEKEINAQLERLKKEPPTAEEMERALNIRESGAIYGLQTVFGKGAQLSSYTGFLNKPDYFQADLDRYRKVTPGDVQRVANQYLSSNRLVMNYIPAKGGVKRPANPDVNKPTSTASKKKDTALIAKQDASLPKAGPDPKFSLPAIEKTKLSNGLNVWIVRQTELPIVSMNLVINAGGTLDAADRSGVALMTSNMLNQGTKTRSAVDIANSLQSIGASVNPSASWDASSVSMLTLTKDLDRALDIYSDVVVNPAFPANELETLRRRALVSFLQRKSSPTAVADVVYNKVLYGDQPYGRQLSGDEKTVKAMTRDDLVNFYNTYYRPNNSTLIVVGDVQKATLMPKLEKAFASWKQGDVPASKMPAMSMSAKPGIYLVDKPGAAQSSVSIGQVGIDRGNPDFYAVQVMNSILGGGGTARLFMNLREDKGYTYGAYSRFVVRRGPGPFSASGEIQTVSTKEAVQEFLKELNGIRGPIPVTANELEVNKQALIRRFPSGFETDGQISNQLSNLVIYGLPDSTFNDFIAKVNAVTLDDVKRVANKYLTPDKMAIVIVGDKSVIEPGLKELNLPITMLDTEGNMIAAQVAQPVGAPK